MVADDNGLKKAYKDFQVSLAPEPEPEPELEPEPPSDTTAPTITIQYYPAVIDGSPAGGRSAQLVASANEEVTGWGYRGPSISSSCGEDIFNYLNPTPAGNGTMVYLTDINSKNTIVLEPQTPPAMMAISLDGYRLTLSLLITLRRK